MSQTQAILFERRSNAVAAVPRGEAAVVVARVNHIPMRTLFSWLARHRAGGWNALRDGARAGRPRKAGPEVARWLYDAITLGDPRQHQFEFCLWTLGVIRGVLKKDKGVEMSKSAISRLLARMGLTPQKPAHQSYKQETPEPAPSTCATPSPGCGGSPGASARTSPSWTRAPCAATTTGATPGAARG